MRTWRSFAHFLFAFQCHHGHAALPRWAYLVADTFDSGRLCTYSELLKSAILATSSQRWTTFVHITILVPFASVVQLQRHRPSATEQKDAFCESKGENNTWRKRHKLDKQIGQNEALMRAIYLLSIEPNPKMRTVTFIATNNADVLGSLLMGFSKSSARPSLNTIG